MLFQSRGLHSTSAPVWERCQDVKAESRPPSAKQGTAEDVQSTTGRAGRGDTVLLITTTGSLSRQKCSMQYCSLIKKPIDLPMDSADYCLIVIIHINLDYPRNERCSK